MRIDAECVSTAAMEDRASEFLRRNAGPVVVDCAEALCAVARVSPRERFSPFPGTDFSGPEKIRTGAPGSYGIVAVWIWEFRVEFHLFMGPNVTEYMYSCQRN